MKLIKILTLFLATFGFTTSNAQSSESEETPKPTTEMTFDAHEFNWGELTEGEKVQNVFRFENTGDHPLVITNAKGSCGCTVPNWPKEPVMPGEYAEILVQFDSKNKKGQQSKRVTITANTDPANIYLTIKGKILKADESLTKEVVRNENNFDINSADVNIYPNPSTTDMHLDLGEFEGQNALIEIYDMMGTQVEKSVVKKLASNPLSFDTSHYAGGTYVVVVKIGEHNRIAKQFTVSN